MNAEGQHSLGNMERDTIGRGRRYEITLFWKLEVVKWSYSIESVIKKGKKWDG